MHALQGSNLGTAVRGSCEGCRIENERDALEHRRAACLEGE